MLARTQQDLRGRPEAWRGRVIVGAALVLLAVQPWNVEAQSRSDTLAVISAAIERAGRNEEAIYLNVDSPAVVIAASRLLPADRLHLIESEAAVFCSDEYAEDDDPVGTWVSVGLTPGDGPTALLPGPDGRPPPFPRPAFYIDAEVSYVSVSRSCLMGRWSNGRQRSANSIQTVELKPDGTGWVVSRVVAFIIFD